MKVFNAACDAVLIRPFAAGVFTPKLESTLINPGRESEVCGPIISGYGIEMPYKMEGRILIRDWYRPRVCWIEENISAEVVVVLGKASLFKQVFGLAPDKFEGFYVSRCDDRQLILF